MVSENRLPVTMLVFTLPMRSTTLRELLLTVNVTMASPLAFHTTMVSGYWVSAFCYPYMTHTGR
jgi:hypothetical protein